MIERLLLTLALLLLVFSIYALVKGLHILRVSHLALAPRQPTLLYFRSDTCGPCLAQARYLDQVQATFADRIYVRKIDADTEPETAARYGVFTVPTTLVIDAAGKVRHINYGLADARRLTLQLQAIAADAPEPTVAPSS